MSGSQQYHLFGKSGSPQINLVAGKWPRFNQNNMTNTKYSKMLW